MDIGRNMRKAAALLMAIVLYYVIHEGAHLLYALKLGVFQRVAFTGLGVQIVSYRDQMSDVQTAVFCILGAVATLAAGWILVFMKPWILKSNSRFFRAVAFYTTIVFLLNDPVYLSVLYPYVGGGDMNGIKLMMPEGAARILFGVILAAHLVVIVKYVYPEYRNRFVNQRQVFRS